MKNFDKGGSGLCLPDRNVETRLITSPARHIRNQKTFLNNPIKWIVNTRTGQPSNRIKPNTGQVGFVLSTILIFVSVLFNDAFAQSPDREAVAGVTPLMVGQKVPDEFWTREHLFYINGDTVRRTLEEYRGKLLVLDFWNTRCWTCIAHQPELDYFKKTYAQDIAVVMVNPRYSKDTLGDVDVFYKKGILDKLGVPDLESIVQDEYLYGLFAFKGFPYYAWINEYGTVQLLTFRNILDRHNPAPFLKK